MSTLETIPTVTDEPVMPTVGSGTQTDTNENQPVLKKKKTPRAVFKFIQNMRFHFPDEEMDFTLDEMNQFTNPVIARYFKIFNYGRDEQRYFEPAFFIVGKLTTSGEIQLSDQPKVMTSSRSVHMAIEGMKKRFGGTYMAFGLSKAWSEALRKTLLLDDIKQLINIKIVVRPNKQAK